MWRRATCRPNGSRNGAAALARVRTLRSMAMDAATPELAVEAGPAATEGSGRPYAPSWVDRIDDWIDGFPGRSWVAYAAIIAVFMLGSAVEPVLDGASDAAVWATAAFWGIVVPLSLWMLHHLGDVAGAAFDGFRPALGATDREATRMRYALTVTPARPALVILIVSVLSTPVYWLADPVASAVVGLSPIGLALRFVSEALFGAVLLILVYQSIRQLRAVGRIHAAATGIDLFRPAPLYAFSTFTARAAIVIALLFIAPTLVSVAVVTATTGILLIVLPWLVGGTLIAATVFIVPLRGMQRRILTEKRRLQDDVGARIETTIASMHERIDADDPAGARAWHEVLQGLVMERDLVDRLPTLPWRPGTLGAVVSAVVAPLALFVATRLLERLI